MTTRALILILIRFVGIMIRGVLIWARLMVYIYIGNRRGRPVREAKALRCSEAIGKRLARSL
ncbi:MULTISPECIES: hypothetical protein [unclassified Cryobacterium]|uniref:hypothetical protein n=1 Tax=unclassified Cryobacterium TaxID=2649013 RepID=UPI00106C4BB5|nr:MULTISPECIES: hypothetical protein [unclassified Cryobacterium]TFC59417.1 hypothetical protein E3O68_00515 [Cryobacterium sp. TMB3-1-2]TFC67213.1 hypothetical protein E3T21_17210 [Cryobacterium sp. TMB3-15]TFC73274.1 hypothetical protein E3T22_16845 [Cryobacterium sp. TMB3-10]TFD46162.1 hypothetical protein E3T58_01480 [Cryobacterium sp. TMB3-12]